MRHSAGASRPSRLPPARSRNSNHEKDAPSLNSPERIDLSGLHVLRIGGQVVIDQIDHDSPAAKAGIGEKDVALKLDGQDVAKMRLSVFRMQLCNETDMV